MNHVLRNYPKELGGGEGGADTAFFPIGDEGYKDTIIDGIRDPEGGEKTEMPTAVPSPFARFDLVRTAFKNIVKNKNLEADKGTNIQASKFDARLVSHTLDLAEYIFEYQARGSKLEILTWHKSGELSHLTKLKKGTNGNNAFASALELYLSQDANTYNFDKMDKIYLFKYGREIIGSTSPVTLFCPSATNLSKLDIRRMEDRSLAFGGKFLPLYRRTFEFQEWFYYLLNICMNKLDSTTRENLNCVFEYARESLNNLENLNKVRSEKLDAIWKDPGVSVFPIGKYSVLNDAPNVDSPVKILGISLCVGQSDIIDKRLLLSDFLIRASVKKGDKKHLVLQGGFGSDGWNYLEELPFDQEIVVENQVDESWEKQRVMPGFSDVSGYYVTISDFLEPYLIKTIYPISTQFYNGGCKEDKDNKGYLLPLKRAFFDFFTIDDLLDGGNDKPKLSIIPQVGGDVEVMLRIPVKKGNISFRRTYKIGENDQRPNEKNSDGGIILEAKFGTTIFPFVKAFGVAKVKYSVQLVDSDNSEELKRRDYALEFWTQDGEKVGDSGKMGGAKIKHRRFDKNHTPLKYMASSDYYRVNDFDFIQFRVNNPEKTGALIIPIWPRYKSGSTKFTFAVDFGTTNTYVAYKTDSLSERAFYLNDAIATLFDESSPTLESNLMFADASDIELLIDREFVPRYIGADGKNKDNIFIFPQRTAIAYSEEMTDDDWSDGAGLDTLLEGNIPFGYEKISQFGNKIATDLKWAGSDPMIQLQMATYLEEIAMLMQAKVLLEGGDLKKTTLIWFYPSSMTEKGIKVLREKWVDYFSDYFLNGSSSPSANNLVSVPESIAPFYAEKDTYAFHGGVVASIDIGGGTTDVAIFGEEEGKTKLKVTTSFKFAGNALFGDGYAARAAAKNGFVLRFAKYFEDRLKDYNKPLGILAELLDRDQDIVRGKASDINAFMFSIENAIRFWRKGVELTHGERRKFSYTEQLNQCGDLKFLILYFYVAVVYYISKILKKNGEPVQYLLFSGTASKILDILGGGSQENLTEFTKKIFKDLGLESKNLEVILVSKPKEVTCNGGLRADTKELVNAGNNSKYADAVIYTCIEGREFVTKNDDNPVVFSEYKKHEDSIRMELDKFHEFFFNLNKDKVFNFSDFWAIDSDVTKYAQSKYKELLDKWLKDSISRNQPVDDKKQPIDEAVSETPFFMPLRSLILELSEQIAKKWENTSI